MKYKIIFFLGLFCILCCALPTTSAIPTIQFQHEETQPGETIIATITTTGEFTKQITSSDIKFFEGRRLISMTFSVIFYEGTHYLYAYTTREGNFTVQIENILYKENDILQAGTISKEFAISKNIITSEAGLASTQILSIKPGFIFTSQTPSIKLTNLGNSSLNLTYNENETFLTPSQSQTITFTPEETISTLTASTYKEFQIPIFYFPMENITYTPSQNETQSENETQPTNETTPTNETQPTNETTPTNETQPTNETFLKINSNLSAIEIFTNTKYEEEIEVTNLGNDTITDLEMTSDIEFIKIEKLKDMSAMQTGILTLILEPENPGHFNGTLNISYIQNETQHILEIPLSIFVLTEGTSPENFQVQNETCEELSGKVCPQETLCNGTATFTKNTNPEYCCLDSCVEIENKSSDSSNFKWLAGIVILAILVLVGLYFYNKQKRVTPQKPREQIRVKTEKYSKRMKGILTKS